MAKDKIVLFGKPESEVLKIVQFVPSNLERLRFVPIHLFPDPSMAIE